MLIYKSNSWNKSIREYVEAIGTFGELAQVVNERLETLLKRELTPGMYKEKD